MTPIHRNNVFGAIFFMLLGGLSVYFGSSPLLGDTCQPQNAAVHPVHSPHQSPSPSPTPSSEQVQLTKISISDVETPKPQAREKKFVFFDLGANKGDSLGGFAQVSQYDQNYGDLPSRGAESKWEAFVFEANPIFNKPLLEMKKLVMSKRPNWTVHLYNESAIGIEDKKVVFHLDTINEQYSYWGSSLKEMPDVVNSRAKGKGKDVEVQMYSFNRLLKECCREEDFVVVKMDIEGTEYDVVKDMAVKGTVPLIDVFYCEWHPQMPADAENMKTMKWMLEEKLRSWL